MTHLDYWRHQRRRHQQRQHHHPNHRMHQYHQQNLDLRYRYLVSLNMIKDLVVEGDKVSFTVMLTTPACPLKEKIRKEYARVT